MTKEQLHTKQVTKCRRGQAGFSLIELIISSALVLLMSTLFVGAILSGQEGSALGGTRTRGEFIAEEGLEAVRTIRDANYLSLQDGTFGVGIVGNMWTLQGVSDTQGVFKREVRIETVDTVTKKVTSTVSWPQGGSRTGTTTLVTYLTDLGLLQPQSKSLQVDVSGGHLSAGTKLVGIKIKNIGSEDIYLSSTTIAWTGGLGTVFTQLKINGGAVWSSTGPGYPLGDQVSSSTIGFTAIRMQPNSQSPFNALVFNANMTGASFTIKFIMSDNSSTTISTPPL